MTDEEEKELRRYLWLNHGHNYMYGDDGEMQCSECLDWDYKRNPMHVVIRAAVGALHATKNVKAK